MDNIEQIIPAGTWLARYPSAGDKKWREHPLVAWALIRSDTGTRVVGLMVVGNHVELVDEGSTFGGYEPDRLGELLRQQVQDDKADREHLGHSFLGDRD